MMGDADRDLLPLEQVRDADGVPQEPGDVATPGIRRMTRKRRHPEPEDYPMTVRISIIPSLPFKLQNLLYDHHA